jgi:hypothetical protein
VILAGAFSSTFSLSLGGNYRLSGLFSFRGAVQDPRLMPRYYFILAYSDQEMSVPSRVTAPGDDAAIATARNAIDALRAELGPEHSKPTMIVKNASGEIIYRYPSN